MLLGGVLDADLVAPVGEDHRIKPSVLRARLPAQIGAVALAELVRKDLDAHVALLARPVGHGGGVAALDAVLLHVTAELRVDGRLPRADVRAAHVDILHRVAPGGVDQQEDQHRAERRHQLAEQHAGVQRAGEQQLLNQSGSPFPRRS